MQFLTRQFFDTLIIIIVIIGLALTFVRLYRDFTRPMPGDPHYRPAYLKDEDNQKHSS
ncbi:MAG TPA: hypothetical protein VHL11_14555 [Phototrophicaceae bacterium]|jgi:hypothetical protein|nr:hypothetical protein [Phototrophicaceae bacterium]